MSEQSNYQWAVHSETEPVHEIPSFFSRFSLTPAAARILIRRGISTEEAVSHFLYDTPEDLHDPFLMKGMNKAVPRILEAIKNREKIVIYGDYDVDGITSTSVLLLGLRKLGAETDFYIPAREGEGYGLNGPALEKIAESGCRLLITVDCGISSADLIDAKPEGMDIIITDHHVPPDRIPEALAVLNPQQKDCPYPDKYLAGVGVAYTLCRGLYLSSGQGLYTDYLELAALGTIADVVPLLGENRIIVREGLARMKNTSLLGLSALMAAAGIAGTDVTSDRVAFTLAPRLNAAGRVTHAKNGVRLFMSQSPEEAQSMAQELCDTNARRQSIEKDIAVQASERLEELRTQQNQVLVVDGKDWHPGVIGIVASRLMERCHRPVLMVSVKDGIGKGSCRSIPAFDMYEALKSQADILIQFGGHHMAAGFSIEEKNIPLLRERLNAYGAERLQEKDFIPILDVEEKIPLSEVTVDLIHSLMQLEPFGCANPNPLFLSTSMTVQGTRRIGREQRHFKCFLAQGRDRRDAVWWNPDEERICRDGESVSAVYVPQINSWNGEHVQLVLKDMKVFSRKSLSVNRTVLADVYRSSRTLMAHGDLPVEALLKKLSPDGGKKGFLQTALRIFEELGFLSRYERDGCEYYHPASAVKKQELSSSLTYMKYRD